jgi:uncharacterized protein YecE (DUF72 family)
LIRWTERIVQLVQTGQAVYGYVHNPYEGHSPATVRRLQGLLAQHIALPEWPPAGAAAQLNLL